MHTIIFKEKYGDRVVQSESRNTIFATILTQRLNEGWYYDEELDAAHKALDEGRAEPFMKLRIDHEYEGYDDLYIEQV